MATSHRRVPTRGSFWEEDRDSCHQCCLTVVWSVSGPLKLFFPLYSDAWYWHVSLTKWTLTSEHLYWWNNTKQGVGKTIVLLTLRCEYSPSRGYGGELGSECMGVCLCPPRIGVQFQHPSSGDFSPKGRIQTFSSCVRSCIWIYMKISVETWRGHGRLELQVVVNSHVCLGVNPRSSARTAIHLLIHLFSPHAFLSWLSWYCPYYKEFHSIPWKDHLGWRCSPVGRVLT